MDFPLFTGASRFTDDTVLTVATAFSLLTDGDYAENYRIFGRLYPLAGYGRAFQGLAGRQARPALQQLGQRFGHAGQPGGVRLRRRGRGAAGGRTFGRRDPRPSRGDQGRPGRGPGRAAGPAGRRAGADHTQEITDRFGYDLDRTVEDIRPGYAFDVSCQGSVPEAIICFLEGGDWEQAVRLAVSLGGDADTQACMAGALAQARFGGVPSRDRADGRGACCPSTCCEIVEDFENKYLTD